MAENNNRNQDNEQNSAPSSHQQKTSVGNQQGTTQTGAQNNGGQNITDHNDQYTEDLRQSGDRSASNRKDES